MYTFIGIDTEQEEKGYSPIIVIGDVVEHITAKARGMVNDSLALGFPATAVPVSFTLTYATRKAADAARASLAGLYDVEPGALILAKIEPIEEQVLSDAVAEVIGGVRKGEEAACIAVGVGDNGELAPKGEKKNWEAVRDHYSVADVKTKALPDGLPWRLLATIKRKNGNEALYYVQ